MGEEIVANRVRRVISEILCVPDYKLIDEAIFVDDLDTDSLNIVELVLALEEEFDCNMSEKSLEDMRTVGDVVKYFTSQTGYI